MTIGSTHALWGRKDRRAGQACRESDIGLQADVKDTMPDDLLCFSAAVCCILVWQTAVELWSETSGLQCWTQLCITKGGVQDRSPTQSALLLSGQSTNTKLRQPCNLVCICAASGLRCCWVHVLLLQAYEVTGQGKVTQQ